MKAIDKFEKSNKAIKVKDMKLSTFLLQVSDYQTSSSTISYQVRVAILTTHGDGETDPSTIMDDKKMSTYKFKDPQNYNALTTRFNKIAQKHNPSAREILRKEVKSCVTVKDCVDLVGKVAYIPPSKITVI
ncbi:MULTISPECIES: hypothetical protein [unclassified Chryseobacterium]|uniref:hypothetical protein n=1 Tax=unclassified Chryseobacterium TaxID=2593645 RepID=UPI00100AD17C|nr:MULTISPECIES: hypothetical protein [unclassified Chryseobacterium]